MAEPLDAHTLAGFAQALQGLLPTIQEGIAACLRDPSQPEVLEDAYEAVQAISDAALMLGLVELDELASAISGVLENLAAEHSPHTIAEAAWAREAVAQLAPYLASVPAMDEAAHPIIPTLLQALRQLPTDPAPETAAPITPMPQNTAEPMADVAAMELHASFLAEAEDHLHTLGQALPAWGAQPEQPELLQTIRRCVHTLKGAAAIVGQHAVAQLTHRMEDLLEALAHGQCALNPTVYDLLLATVDVLDHFLRDQRAQGDLGPQATAGLYQRYAVLLGEVPTSPSRTPTPVSPVLPTAGLRRAAEMVRIPIERLDELVRLVSELVISRSVYEQHLGRLSRHVDELRLSMDRLRRVTATVETQLESSLRPETVAFLEGAPALARPHQDFDVLEFERYGAAQLVSRELSETTADIGALEQELGDIFGDLDGYLTRHGRLTSEMQDKLMRLRMVPLASLATRLHRTVRVTATQQGKDVELQLLGAAVEFDKTVLEDMAEPLLHLLRNAIDHGIEPPELRQALGKPLRGQIQLRAFTEGTQVVIQVSDDGAGLVPQALRTAAIHGGFFSEAEAAELTPTQLMQLVFTPGFSTAAAVSEVSGRGVGMDIVQTTVNRLKGSVELTSTPGQGCLCTMRLPLTLAITRVLLVQAHGATFAMPLADVTRVLRLEPEAIERVGNMQVIRVDGQVIPVLRLGEQLRIPQPGDTPLQRAPVVLTQTGDAQVAFLVDELLGGREVVVKTLGNHLRRVRGVIGSTLLGDGSIVLILHLSELIREAQTQALPSTVTRPGSDHRQGDILDVLIVDDSLSVRRVVANLIRSAGWRPLPAKDGREALDMLQRATHPPDIILLDIEMPQMDGYELTATLRAQATYQHIPIIMLTSRAGDKHRQTAMAVGATAYLVKPYQDDILLAMIRRLVPRAGGITAA